MKEELKYSFYAANTFPLKILLNKNIIKSCLDNKKIPSIHYQLNPTNKCNFKCSYCSCSERDRELELSYSQIKKITEISTKHGCLSATITGGGEPTLHPDFDHIIDLLQSKDIETGLVTNGTVIERRESLDKITWIRISASDFLEKQLSDIGTNIEEYLVSLRKTVEEHALDWAFSYVLCENPNTDLIIKLIEFANEHKFTHVRIVNDVLKAERLTLQMKNLKRWIKQKGIDDSIVNYQDRSYWATGQNPCYISILKPVIGADGYIYPCCGTQYALKNPSRDYEKKMRMGTIQTLEETLSKQLFFDGSICQKCYYSEYNLVLGTLLKGLKHSTFV